MGPDCGTGILDGDSNCICKRCKAKGVLVLLGLLGTGIQEVTVKSTD